MVTFFTSPPGLFPKNKRQMGGNSWGAIHSTKISENFGPKLEGSVRSNWKSFEKTGPPFDVVLGRDPFNQNFRKFRSTTQWIGSVQPEKFRKNGSTFWGGPLFPVGPVWILVEWIAPLVSVSSMAVIRAGILLVKSGIDIKRNDLAVRA